VVVKVKEAYPIGSFYGASSEITMMQEIRKNGPIVADFSPPMTFQMYNDGIFSDDHSQILAHIERQTKDTILQPETINKMTLNDYDVEWQKIEHSITIVGWGEEEGIKFWIC
jgi:ADP-ribosylglycohydrolase